MSEPAWSLVRREIVRLAGGADLSALADADLLALFAESRRAEAFTEIVHRYGPQVYGVCRRGLRSPADADDAFQATFLVLARCARAVRRRTSLAGWLHGIARRVVARAYRDAARRPAVPLGDAEPPAPDGDPSTEAVRAELQGLIDEELARLPEKYRAPLLLCYFGGQTNEEAAKVLGWPAGTVCGRLARARDLLRDRLSRRGVALAAGGLASPVPSALQQATARLATSVPANVTLWTEEVMRSMFLTTLFKKSLLAVAGVAALGLGTVAIARTGQPPAPGGGLQPLAPVPPAPTDDEAAKLRLHLTALMKQRADAARKQVEARLSEFKAGRGTLDILLDAVKFLRQAELELATDPRDRIAAHERTVQTLTEIDETCTRWYDAGRLSIQDHAQARGARLDAEIALTRARLELLRAGAG